MPDADPDLESAPIHDPAQLTRHIERRRHARCRAELPELVALAARVEAVGADQAAAPAGMAEGACRSWRALYDGLDRFLDDRAEHMRLENEALFPPFERAAAARA